MYILDRNAINLEHIPVEPSLADRLRELSRRLFDIVGLAEDENAVSLRRGDSVSEGSAD